MWGNNNGVDDRKGFINDSMARNGACRQFIINIARFDRLVLFTRPKRSSAINYKGLHRALLITLGYCPEVRIYDDILIAPTMRWEH